MQRVLVVGIPGGGKTTLAMKLAEKTGLPLIELDQVFWRPGWKVTPRDEWRMKLTQMVAEPRWIIAGHYGNSLDIRLPRADTVIICDRNRVTALRRAAMRMLVSYGRQREGMAEGCPERFELDFFRYIWRFNDRERPRLIRALSDYGAHATIHLIPRNSTAHQFLASVPWTIPSTVEPEPS